MKMGKKVREYKSGDFIFAKVKGYPAWPARVQRLNGKKYFVYFYGTGETANLPPNMIFDYAENKDKFLTKTVKRRDFNDGVKQIEYDFANNVPLEQVIGLVSETPDNVNNTINDTLNETADETMADTTADESIAEENTTQNDTAIEDSDETGGLIIDEGGKPKPAKRGAKTPAKETPKPKEVKTPRRGKKEETEIKDEKRDEEIVSRSGRKIRPKRYIDEHTEENSTLPSPAPKKRRASPIENEKENTQEKDSVKQFNVVTQNELEDLKEPFAPEDPEKDTIIITYLPSGQYVGIKLFQSRPSFKNEASRLQWDKQAASNALTLKMQLEKGQITAQSVIAQLVMDLNLSDQEKAMFDKERETEEKKSRVQFLKTEMKLIELDAKIKTCLCLEKADTELCLKLLDELMELELKPLMLLKHPSCLETIKRMRAYVGNTPSWELSEEAVLQFSQHAGKIRRQADVLYNNMKELFPTLEGLSFWEFFTERVSQFKKATSKLSSDELLELVHEPLEMSVPTSHTMKSAVEAANEDENEESKKKPPVKSKKVNSTPSKPPLKRQSSRKQQQDEKEKEKETKPEEQIENTKKEEEKDVKDKDDKDSSEIEKDSKENEITDTEKSEDANTEVNEAKDKDKDKEEVNEKEAADETQDNAEKESEKDKAQNDSDKDKQESTESDKDKNDKDVKEVKGKNSKEDKSEKKEEKEKVEDEPRAKRTRESKKTDPPPRSPTKRKAKMN
ncbi:myb-like protein X [Danaus plexippus]|uniref:myb-like protein X n=1 Tax=Danaus plexippus TaxID=13037 RepID=UPI002AB0E612|nr:myb-like protein X [Danaus plexippus]XP_032525232.2 myb-like protein X [Danaus plexippus]